jgi:hypothetical protein
MSRGRTDHGRHHLPWTADDDRGLFKVFEQMPILDPQPVSLPRKQPQGSLSFEQIRIFFVAGLGHAKTRHWGEDAA